MPRYEPGAKGVARRIVRDPVYSQLCALLREHLGSGKFRADDKFLTEREISHRFDVSRVTANKALSHLVVTGLLQFRKGVGTFVRQEGLQNDLGSLVSFTRKAQQAGLKPTTSILAFGKHAASEVDSAITKALDLTDRPAAPVYHFVRLRLADNVPVILEKRWVSGVLCPGLHRDHVKHSLYEMFTEKFGLRIASARQTIRSVNLPREDAILLGVKAGSAALWIHAVGMSAGEPLWVEDTFYRGDRYEFQNEITEKHTATRPVFTITRA